MTDRKCCGKQWPAHLCAPGSLHQCARIPGHGGQCCCKCGLMIGEQVKKGPLGESQVVAFLRDNGFPHVERRLMGGSRDRGDVAGIPGLVIEIKNSPDYLRHLSEWADEATEEASHADDVGLVWHKRKGRGSPGDWYVTMSGWALLELLKAWTK